MSTVALSQAHGGGFMPGEPARDDFDLGWIGRRTGPAERRQVVVLAIGFERALPCDPEEMVELLADRRSFVARIVARYGGTVGRVDPDLQIVAWGWPVAGETDTRLAIAAALDMAADPEHKARCGADAGIAVTADAQTGFAGLGFIGEMVTSAVAQQAVALAGEVLVGEAVHSLIADAFDLSRCDGLSAPARLWRVRRSSGTKPRRLPFHVRRAELFGRASEIEQLSGLWRDAAAGQAGFVRIEGEGGVGKSALIGWLDHAVTVAGAVCVVVQCQPECRHLELEPLRHLLGELSRLPSPLCHAGTDGCMLIDPSPYAGDIEGNRLAAACRDALDAARVDAVLVATAIFELASYKSSARPLALVVEDLQWADEATFRVVATLGSRSGARARLLCAATRRPGQTGESSAMLTIGGHVISLRPLPTRIVEQIVAAGEHGGRIDHETRQRIARMADGNPFRACELARLTSASALESAHRRLLAGPNRLNGGLTERLDALAALKPVAQAAAVLGRLFDERVLAAALDMDVKVLSERLEMLVGMGILARLRSRQAHRYRFQDSLLWAQAYGSVLRTRRRHLHLRIAMVLSGPFGETVEAAPELVAHHWKRSGDVGRSFSWWLRASLTAAEEGAAAMSVSYANEALSAMQAEPKACSLHQEATLMSVLGAQLRALRGGGANETEAAYRRALEIVSAMPSKPGDIDLEIAWGLAAIHLVRGDIRDATESSSKLLSDAAERNREDIMLLAMRLHGTSRLMAGCVGEAIGILEDAVARYDRRRHGELHRRYVSDPGAVALAHLASARAVAGHREASQEARQRALALAAEIGHSHTTANVLGVLALSAMHLGEHGTATALARAGQRIAREHGHAYWQARGNLLVAWSAAVRDPAGGLGGMIEAAEHYHRIGAGRATAFVACLAAEIAIKAEMPQRALELLAPVRMRGKQQGEWLYVPEVRRLEARALSMIGGTNAATVDELLDKAHAMALELDLAAFLPRIAATRTEIEADGGRRVARRRSRRQGPASAPPSNERGDRLLDEALERGQ